MSIVRRLFRQQTTPDAAFRSAGDRSGQVTEEEDDDDDEEDDPSVDAAESKLMPNSGSSQETHRHHQPPPPPATTVTSVMTSCLTSSSDAGGRRCGVEQAKRAGQVRSSSVLFVLNELGRTSAKVDPNVGRWSTSSTPTPTPARTPPTSGVGASRRVQALAAANWKLMRADTAPVGQLLSKRCGGGGGGGGFGVSVGAKIPPTPASLSHFDRQSDGYRLSAQQRTLIRRCWHSANRREPGQFVFRYLFRQQPRLRRMFDVPEQLIEEDRLIDSDRFVRHSAAFTNVLDMVIDSMGEEDSASPPPPLDDTIGPFLAAYGAKHAQIERRLRPDCQFQHGDWDLFGAAMREFANQNWRMNTWPTPANLHKRNEALYAWRVLVQFIVTKIKHGYDLERQEYGRRRKPEQRLSGGAAAVLVIRRRRSASSTEAEPMPIRRSNSSDRSIRKSDSTNG